MKDNFNAHGNHEMNDIDNLHELFGANANEIADFFKARFPDVFLHVTNGTYMLPAEKIVPTTIAGFAYLNDRQCCKKENDRDVFVIAVNSDVSMQKIADQKNWSDEQRAQIEPMAVRAYKVALPLINEYPNRHVVIVTYDDDTPTALYDALAESGLKMATLHKWGYGTDPNAPRIEGAYNFSTVFAFPMPNDERPVCHDITVREDQSGVVEVIRLTDRLNHKYCEPYILPNGQLPKPPTA